MTKIKNTLAEIHLYSNKIEYLIKLIIWIVSWIGGIYVLRNKTDGVSSAYFIFSLSLLMEFAQKIKGKKGVVSRIVHTLFCFAVGAMLLLSAFLLLDNSYDANIHSNMNTLSKAVLVFMALDCAILWFSRDGDENTPGNNKDTPDTAQETVAKFNERLMAGSLGDIGEVN